MRRKHWKHRLDLFVKGKDNSGGCRAFHSNEIGYIAVAYIPSGVGVTPDRRAESSSAVTAALKAKFAE